MALAYFSGLGRRTLFEELVAFVLQFGVGLHIDCCHCISKILSKIVAQKAQPRQKLTERVRLTKILFLYCSFLCAKGVFYLLEWDHTLLNLMFGWKAIAGVIVDLIMVVMVDPVLYMSDHFEVEMRRYLSEELIDDVVLGPFGVKRQQSKTLLVFVLLHLLLLLQSLALTVDCLVSLMLSLIARFQDEVLGISTVVEEMRTEDSVY
jgi:hypothetical protein